MAILLDKAGTQHYANKMVLAENRKVGNKSLPSALADIDGLIDEMKGQFEAEYGSALDMKLENNENVFSVGTGSGIDRRGEVENSFTDVEIFGNSMVNLIRLSNTYPLKGTANGTQISLTNLNLSLLKPSTEYTLITHIPKNTLNHHCMVLGWGVADNITPYILKGVVGTHILKFTTKSDFEKHPNLHIWQESTSGEIQIDYQIILEGDYTNKPLPQYFEGLKSIGEKEGRNEIEVLSIGENLFDNANIERGNISSGVNSGSDLTSHSFMRTPNFIQVKPNTVYSIKFHTPTNNVTLEKIMEYKAKIKDESGWSKSIVTTATQFMFTTNANTKYVRLTFKNSVDSNIVVTNEHLINSKIHFKEYVYSDEYLPYKIDKKQISLSEPLRGLPNGVRDTIEIINGEWKIVRRCGEAILNGSEVWIGNPTWDTEYPNVFHAWTNFPLWKIGQSSAISDKYNYHTESSRNLNEVQIHCHSTSNNVYINAPATALTSLDIDGFKNWLQNNPTKVIYELTTPIIEDIDPVTLQCWKNGAISIDSTVPPTTTHTVALNKPAQIKRNIEELTALRDRVLTLEEQYDQIALEQAHKLQLLNHSFELDYNI